MPLHLLLRFLLAQTLMFDKDDGGGGGSGGGDGDGADDDDADDGDGDEDDDDPGDDPEKLKARLAAIEADRDKWKRTSRKHEDRAKANRTAAQERDDLKKKGLPPDEKALQEARDAGKAEAAKEGGVRLARSEVRAELKGRVSDAQRGALIEALDLSRFLDDEHEVDTDKVAEWVESVAPKSDKDDDSKKRKTDLGQGRRSQGGKPSVQSGQDLYEKFHPAKTP